MVSPTPDHLVIRYPGCEGFHSVPETTKSGLPDYPAPLSIPARTNRVGSVSTDRSVDPVSDVNPVSGRFCHQVPITGNFEPARVRRCQPTDFLVFQSLFLYGRNVGTNLAALPGKGRKNVTSRLSVLADYGLVRKIGPAEHFELYEITDKGERALPNQDRFDAVADFESLIELPSDGDPQASAPLLRGGADRHGDDG